MKKFRTVFIAVALLLVAGIFATAGASENIKLGALDLMRTINESDAGKKAKSDLEALIKSKQSAIDEKGKNIEKLRADLEKQSALLSSDAKKVKEEEIERLIRDYQRTVSDSQEEVKKKEGELTSEIIRELRELISKVGQEEKYSLILEMSEGGVLYADKSIDITEVMMKKYNEAKAGKK